MAKTGNLGLVNEPTISETDRRMQAPQSPNDRHDEKYDNDASGWVRGMAKPYPTFDSTVERLRKGGGKNGGAP